MIHHVVIAMKNASRIGRRFIRQPFFHLFRIVRSAIPRHAAPIFFPLIKTYAIVRTAFPPFTLETEFRASFGRVFFFEKRKLPEGGNDIAVFSHEIRNNIEIVTAFLQDHGRTVVPAPVAAHETVRLMPISHALRLTDGNHTSQLPGIENLFEGIVKRRVAQYMANEDVHARSLRRLSQFFAILFSVGYRLFEQYGTTLFNGGESVLAVLLVLRGDNDKVVFVHVSEQLAVIGKTLFSFQSQIFTRVIEFFFIRIADSRHFRNAAVFDDIGIEPASSPQPDCIYFNHFLSPVAYFSINAFIFSLKSKWRFASRLYIL